MRQAKVISITNQKGGVGKTTTSINLATALAAMDQKTLLIDLDPQGNCSTGLGITQNMRKKNIYDLLFNNCHIHQTIIKTAINNLYVISANNDLSAAEFELASLNNREYIIKNLLSQILSEYDYILIDCPPSLGLLTVNALVASNEVIIPLQCEFYAIEGLSHLMTTIDKIKNGLNRNIIIGGILLTMYDKRSNLTGLVEEDVRNYLGKLVFKTVIPRNVRLSEAPSHGMPAIIYDYRCTGSMAYILLTKEILINHNKLLEK